MKRRGIGLVLAGLLAAMTMSGCGGVARLDAVQGLSYADGILSFDAVAGATGYEVSFAADGKVLKKGVVDVTSLDVESLDVQGDLDVTVQAVASGARSVVSRLAITVLSVFDEVRFEAEDYLYNFGTGKQHSNFRNNPLASNMAYVGGLDDAGQGIYINYLCPFAGTYELEAAYLRSDERAQHDVWVNGAYQTRFVYEENTGWGGESFTPAKTSVEVTLKRGWNTISVMKNGTSADNWGSFAELDYLTLYGNGQEYNASDLASFGTRPPFLRLEAEMGSPRRRNRESFAYECVNPCIVQSGSATYSNGFLMGNIESTYDGVEWQIYSEYKARYRVVLAYASGQFSAEEDEYGKGSSPAAPTLIVTQTEVLPHEGVDFRKKEQAVFDPLPYTGWNNVTVAEQTVEITLEQGKNFIYCIKMGDSGYFQLDYIDLVLIGYEK